MLKSFLVLLLIFVQATSFAQLRFEEGILKEAFAKSKFEEKPVFLFIYLDGCSHCEQFKTTFNAMTTGADFYNENFINAKVEINSEEGKKVRFDWGINVVSTPLFTFWDSDTTLLSFEPSTDILNSETAIIQMGTNALDPKKYWEEQKRTISEISDIGTLAQMAFKARIAQDTITNMAVIDRYVAVKGKDRLSTNDFMLIKQAVMAMESPLFTYLINNKPAFVEAYGQKDVYGTIENIVMFSLMSSRSKVYDDDKLTFMKMTLQSIGLPDQKVKARFLLFETNRYFANGENDKAIALFEDYYKGATSVHPNEASFVKKHLKEKTGQNELPEGLKALIEEKLQK